jgi:hypothetical protein
MGRRCRHLNMGAAGMGLHLDPRFISGVSNGAAISTWNDRSPNANNATESGSTRPTYQTAAQGGSPVVRFAEASSQKMTCGSSAFSGANQRVLIAAYKSTGTGSFVHNICGESNLEVPGTWFMMQARTIGATGDPYIAGYFADTTNNATTPDNQWKVATAAWDGSSMFARKNGVQVDVTTQSLNTVNTPFRIGYTFATLAVEFHDGDIGTIAAGQRSYSLPIVKRIEHSIAYSYKLPCS